MLQVRHVRLHCNTLKLVLPEVRETCSTSQKSFLISAGPYKQDEVEGVAKILSAYKQLQVRLYGCDVDNSYDKRHCCPKAGQMYIVEAATKDIIHDEWSVCDRRQLHNYKWQFLWLVGKPSVLSVAGYQ